MTFIPKRIVIDRRNESNKNKAIIHRIKIERIFRKGVFRTLDKNISSALAMFIMEREDIVQCNLR